MAFGGFGFSGSSIGGNIQFNANAQQLLSSLQSIGTGMNQMAANVAAMTIKINNLNSSMNNSIANISRVSSVSEASNIVNKLLSGVVLDGRLVKADYAREIQLDTRSKRKHRLFETVIHEGLNRQIRRMFQQIGYPVVKLLRTSIGSISLGDLKKGNYKEISRQEAYAIFNSKK